MFKPGYQKTEADRQAEEKALKAETARIIKASKKEDPAAKWQRMSRFPSKYANSNFGMGI